MPLSFVVIKLNLRKFESQPQNLQITKHQQVLIHFHPKTKPAQSLASCIKCERPSPHCVACQHMYSDSFFDNWCQRTDKSWSNIFITCHEFAVTSDSYCVASIKWDGTIHKNPLHLKSTSIVSSLKLQLKAFVDPCIASSILISSRIFHVYP